jgi:hypothetical protein
VRFPYGRLPPGYERRIVHLAPGRSLAHDEAGWRDAIVVVAYGIVEVEGRAGGRRPFRRGDVLFLAGPGLRALHNRGPGPAVLVGVRRAQPVVPYTCISNSE